MALYAVAGIFSSSATAGDRTWVFSGSELIDALKGDLAPETADKELKRMLSTARGTAYVAGVADALQGREWCGAGAILPHEMTDRVYTYLKDLPPEQLKENAAPLVGQALSKEFPCKKRK
ncbi:Rap1a/Tai family immunity protein [Brucella endophytica]|nr:Rap1a/Tai family immunity protein [Brucella endophytica]